ncbi:MFS transporter [Thalassobacillus sp. CUG 92003]|uniref:MFS transporter n=1 Tax=Thalassobacillus sp. CUG 92003 TaxID=2736641 RepID=UPI0015E6492A|nr:MFS transporter [Thalassobacillus sp. CUG 92003]
MRAEATRVEQEDKLPAFQRNYPAFRFMGGNLVSFFGDQLYLLAIPLIVLALTGSPLSMGIVAALERLPILIQPFTGVLADRFNRKRILLICDAGRGIVIGGTGLLYLLDALVIWEIYIAAFIAGMLTQVYNTSQFASIPQLVQKQDFQLVNSINSGMLNLAVFIGPGLGGILISFYNPGWALVINSVTFLIGFITVLSLNVDHKRSTRKGMKMGREIKEGFDFVIKHKPILFTNIAMLFSIFGTTLFLTMMIVHLKTAVELDAAQIGWLLSVGGVGAIGGSLTTNLLKKYVSYRMILFSAGVTGGISIILFSMSDTYIWLVAMNAVGTIAAAVMSPCIVTIRQNLSPAHLLGRVQATSRFMTWLLMPVAAFVSGILAEYIGTSATIMIGGSIATAASVIYLHASLKMV